MAVGPAPGGRAANPAAPTAASRWARKARSSTSSSGAGHRSRGPRQEQVGEARVAGQRRPVRRRCRGPVPTRAPSVPSPPPLPTPRRTRARGWAPAPSRVTAEWFSKPVSVSSATGPASRSPSLGRDGRRGELPHGPAPGPLHRDHVEQPHPGMGPPVGPGERPADHLVAGAHREHHGTGLHRTGQHPVAQALGRLHLGPVLAPAEAVDVGAGGKRRVGEGVDELHRDVAPHGPPGQHLPVAAVAVGAEQVGVHDHDAQRRRARGASGARGAASRRTPALGPRHRGHRHGHPRRGRRRPIRPATGGSPTRAGPRRAPARRETAAQRLEGGVVADVLHPATTPRRAGPRDRRAR